MEKKSEEMTVSRPDVEVTKVRRTMYELLNSLVQKIGKNDDWKSLLDMIHSAVKHCPQVILTNQCSHTPMGHAHKPPAEEHAFLLWIVSSLLRVEALSTSQPLRGNITDAVLRIFELVKVRAHFVFCYLLSEQIQLLSDLSELRSHNFLSPIYLSHYQYSWNKNEMVETDKSVPDFYPWLIELRNHSQLNSLLVCSLDILAKFPHDLSQFCQEDVNTLCHALGSCLECAYIRIKQRTLTLFGLLIDHMTMASRVELDHLTLSTIALLASPAILTTNKQSMHLEFEASLAGALRALFCSPEGAPVAVLRFWTLLSVNLTADLNVQVYPKLSKTLQECVGELLVKCNQLGIEGSGAKAVLTLFGKASNLQPLVPCLLFRIRQALYQGSKQHDETSEDSGSSKKPRLEERKLLSRSKLVKRHLPIAFPDLVLLLVEKMMVCATEVKSICSSCESEKEEKDIKKLLCGLEGMKAGLDVYGKVCTMADDTPTFWWSVDQLKQLCSCWEQCLYDLTASRFGQAESHKKTYFNELLRKVLDCVGALGVCMAAGVSINSVVIDRCIWIVMLLWPQSSSPRDSLVAGSSLTPLQCQYLKQSTLELVENGCKCCSLYALSSFPVYTATTHKVSAFSAALRDEDPQILEVAVECVPLVMNTLDKDAVQILTTSFNQLSCGTKEVQMALIKELVPLCLASMKVSMKRIYPGNGFSLGVHKCCKLKTVEERVKVNPKILSVVLNLLDGVTDIHIIIALVEKLASLSPYIPEDEHSVIHSKCQALFSHDNAQLRLAMSVHIRLFFPDPNPPLEQVQLEKLPVILKLKECFTQGGRNRDTGLQVFAVTAFGNIARFAEGNLFVTCLYALLNFVLDPSHTIKATSYNQLKCVAKSHNMALSKLLKRHKMQICQFLVSVVHEQTALALSEDLKKNLFYQVAVAFGLKEIKQLFEHIHDLIVPLLVCRASPESSQALKFIATHTNMISRSLLVESIKHIYLYIVKNGQQQDLNTASKFLKTEANFEMTELLQTDIKSILNLLLLHLTTHHTRVVAAIKLLATMNQSSVVYDTDEKIPDYLGPHLHGIVAHFNIVLVRLDYFENSEKGKQAIGSLAELMKLMGKKYITNVKMKIMAVLRHCLTFSDPDVVLLTLSAWNCFINCVELDSLGPLLGQIVVALSPVIPDHPQNVAEIFEFLIIENKAILAPYFNEIYLMPDNPELADVNKVLKEHASAQMSFHERIHHVLKGVLHERSDVRSHALKALHKLLNANKAKLEKYTIGSDTVDPVITEIVTTLLRSLRGASAELREDYGICLGELGAIDPGKLEIPIASQTQIVPFYEVDSDFAVDILGELVRAYLAATSIRNQDCCAFAMQEILLLFECGSEDLESEGSRIWSTLSAESQEVLRPHLTSSYSATTPKVSKPKLPFFQPSKNITFHEWIKQWCTFLIHKVSDNRAKKIFLPCSLIFQHDKSIATYLLPYVLITILKQGNSELDQLVHREIMAVLNHCVQNRDIWQEQTDLSNMCAQTIFTLLDHLHTWAVGKNRAAAIRRMKNQTQRGNPQEISNVFAYLKGIPKDTLAHSAFRCQAYTRALMYLESYLNDSPSAVKENLGFVQKIYVSLDDDDGVAGVAAVRKSSSTLPELILEYESVGNYRSAAACYERIIQLGPDDLSHHEGLLCCMMRQGEFTSTLMHVDGLQAKRPEWSQRLNCYRVEASWKLGQWDDLETYLKGESPLSKNWDVNLGRLLLAAKQQDYKSFMSRLSKVRGEQMGPLCTASVELGSYQRGYEYILRLHMLHELESGVEWLLNQESSSSQTQSSLLSTWETRSKLIQESFRTQEPVLSLRRVIMGLTSKRDKEIGKYWMKSAKIARRAGHLQTALSFLLNAKDYALPEIEVEWARYKNTQSSSYEALLSLQKAVGERWPEVTICLEGNSESATRNPAHADALLLIGQWMEGTAHFDTGTVLKQYKSVITVYPESEDGHFFLGKYYDRLMSVLASDRLTKSAEFLQFIIRHYAKALEFGNKYIYQCMPRMLTLWLDFGSSAPDSSSGSSKRSQNTQKYIQCLTQLNKLMKDIVDRLPPYQFLIAFSQLISRICHPNSDVFALLESIILKLLDKYSQQALWMMIAVSKSTHSDRESKCRRILDKAKKEMSHCVRLIDDMEKLCDRLLEVCNKGVEPSKNHSMDKLCRGLVRLTSTSRFSSIMVPLQSSLNVTLPGDGNSGPHNPFPGAQPTIEKFEDRVEVLPSLQRPKKVTVLASDGKSYIFLCKPKDDLRKDARLMEFNSLVNKCLRKDQESRQRRLHIRTYAVVPLNEECGLLEWIPNTHGFRNILLKLYQEKGIMVGARELKEIMRLGGDDSSRKKEVYIKQLLPKHPPVFGEWFLRTFPDPTSWYSSRQAYAHTSAVMSIVGYVLGLGDRHGENILFDSTNGDCVHVDFNCLFNRGETFDVPEVVPFRLTHNMVHGLGVTGYEGSFRKSCEAAIKVLRQECDALVCVLKTFIHDPLVEWEKVKGRQTTAEATNEKAVKIVRDIEDRLQGKVHHKTKGLPLSVEGQVHAVIKEATDVDNLSRMYIGWAPFM